jgi:hypothetical protein
VRSATREVDGRGSVTCGWALLRCTRGRARRAIGAQAVPAHDAWEKCIASVVRAELGSKTPAEEVAEEALRRCTDREGRLIAVLARGIGRQKARTVVGELRNVQRESLISVIEELVTRVVADPVSDAQRPEQRKA